MAVSPGPAPFTPSIRAQQIAPSASMALDAKAKGMKAAGQPVISFGVGEPDFGTPEPINRAAARAIAEGLSHYTTVGGEPALRQAIADFTAENCGVQFKPTQVIATSGAKEALYIAFQATCDPGDDVLIPAPYWVSYSEQARLAGANPVIIRTDPANWKLTPDLLRQHLSPRSKLLVLCTPSNPTGIVYSDAELSALADVVRESGIGVMVDEIYARISYVPVGRWLRVAPDLADQTLIVDGVSKAYAMTGWRCGWLVGPQNVLAACNAIESHLTSHPSSISQRAALYALKQDAEVESTVDAMVVTFRERRDAIVEELRGIEGLTVGVPDGAFYVYPDVRGLLGRPLGPKQYVAHSSNDVCDYLLNDVLVNTVPGEAFGTPGFIRFSYALSMKDLREGCQRVRDALK